MRIEIDVTRCSGCRYCELWCSFRHEGVFSPFLSRITIVKNDVLGMDYPVLCRFCEPAPCIRSCPTGALRKNKLGAVEVDESKCVRCGECVKACPYGAVKQHPRTKVPLACDLCGGNPVCVNKCPTGALRVVPVGYVSTDTPEGFGKEYKYALTQHKTLMKVWGLEVR